MTYGPIEKNVPMPSRGNSRPNRGALYQLEPGDSVLITDRPTNSVRRHVCIVAKKIGGKFATRAVEGGVRVWRIE